MATVNNLSSRKLKCASQAEILRSYQRDDDFVKRLQDKLSKILQNLGMHKTLFQYIQSEIPFKLIYFVFTSGIGNQTLGEEYTGIVQANLEARKVPILTVRVLGALLECFGEKFLLKILERLQTYINHPSRELTSTAVTCLNIFLSKLRAMIPVFILLHKGMFYIFGRYYSLGRRIAGLNYAKIYGQQPDVISWGLKFLGIATIIQCLLRIWQSATMQNNTIKYDTSLSDAKSTTHNCQLCLEAKATTATLCGHIFCWNCLSDWLRAKPQCPFCREYVPPSRIIHLMNL